MATLKIDKIKREYTINDKYYPIVEANLAKNERRLIMHIAEYRDKNAHILSSPYLTNYPVFSQADEKIIFTACKVDMIELKRDILKVKLPVGVSVKKNFEPFPTLMILMMKYYMSTKQEKKLRVLYYYMAYSMYWSIFTKYFKVFLPRQGTMIYTIDNLSNKFILKQLRSIDALLFYSVDKTIELYTERVMRSSDAELYYIIDAIKTRINNYINKITNEYMQNYANNEIVLQGNDDLEEGGQRDSSSIAGDVEILAQEYTTKFFSEPPRIDLINQISKLKGVSTSELRTTLTLLVDEQLIDEVRVFYESIFYLYLSDSNSKNKNIKSMSFLGIMESIYKKGNSGDKNILKIKELMNKWLESGSSTYRATNRSATQNDFRKAIYYYFIFLVSNNK